MRVIAGTYRSRALKAPEGLATRPTSDRLRETLFNVLALRIEGAAFLDLYAGSGAVGIEALSRGAARVEFVEKSAAALATLRENLQALGLRSTARVHAVSASTFLRSIERSAGRERYGIVFMDPPYDADQEYAQTLGLLGATAHSLLAEGAVVVAEHRRKERLEDRYGALARTRLLEQGDASLSFYALLE